MGLAARVASRYRQAKEFPSEKALNEYLKEHPDADRTQHSVNENKAKGGPAEKPGVKKPKAPPPAGGKTPPKPPPPAGPKSTPPKAPKSTPPPIPDKAKKKPESKPEAKPQPKAPPAKAKAPEAPKETAKPAGKFDAWKARFKGLSESATKFVEAAPKAVKHFFGDDEFRKKALGEAKDALVNAPKKMITNLVTTAKHEVHEFKTAAEGVKAVMQGGKMTKKQKSAFKEVATHMAIGGAAAAFAASGPLMAAGVFAKNLARHVAMKSVSKHLGDLHMLEELGHVGHGVAHLIQHIASEDKDAKGDSAEDAMAKFMMAAVAKEIEQLTDEDFQEVLNSMGAEAKDKKTAAAVVSRYLASRT